MNRKFLTLALAAVTVAYAPLAFSQSTESKSTTEKVAAATDQVAEDVKKTADEAAAKATAAAVGVEAKLEKEIAAPAAATPAPEASSATAEVEALKTIFLERRRLNYKKVELDFAKEKALNKNSDLLQQQTEVLYGAAVQNLNSVIGNVSEPQAEETYFEYDMDEDSGEFVIIQIRDSYLKAERGDVCQVSTRVHLITSLEKELPSETSKEISIPVAASTETSSVSTTVSVDPNAPVTESYTEIKCYNDKRTTYHQLLMR